MSETSLPVSFELKFPRTGFCFGFFSLFDTVPSVFLYLKNNFFSLSLSRVRDFWSEPGPASVLNRLQRKELTLFRAAEILNVTVTTLANYLSTLRQEDAGPYARNDYVRDIEDGNHDILMGHMEEAFSFNHGQLVKQETLVGMGGDDDIDSENSHGGV